MFSYVNDEHLRYTTVITHKINTGNSPPIKQNPHLPPFAHLVSQLASPWSSPIILVKKKAGEMSFCNDYRKLNAVIIGHALLRVDDILDSFENAE